MMVEATSTLKQEPVNTTDTLQSTVDRKLALTLMDIGFQGVATGLQYTEQSLASKGTSFNYRMQASASRRDASSALFVGRQQANVARAEGKALRGVQQTAQSASGFAAGVGSNLDTLLKTDRDTARVVADIQFATQEKVNDLNFQAEMADINSRLHNKLSGIQKKVGMSMQVIGLLSAGYGAYKY